MAHAFGMMERVEIKGRERYGDVLDVVEYLAASDYGTASNALAVLARRSPLYKQARAQLDGSRAGRKRKTA